MTINLAEILAVAGGGAIGCLGRYFADKLDIFQEHTYNTILINLAGCFIIGILWVLFTDSDATLKSRFFITGLLGGFTTFSAFSLHPLLMIRNGDLYHAALYVFISVIGGLFLCAIGVWLAERIIK